ncbi:GntR family transcriptional regulator [Enterococcus massiliensis]|uniref:GntR family transcriptional regulator n=1 Tax=Enterococcus massiliensis TaxID=1640685 RepID=UPI00065E440D|nr:GntR family transcriptional regulator [Enterococcus massiliensis]
MKAESNRPLYIQVESAIRNDILQKKYLPGEQLPTEEELCKIYGVSKVTVRKAFQLLTTSGLVERSRGKGTFVKQRKKQILLGVEKGFNDSLGNNGHIIKNSLIHTQFLPADNLLAKKLQVSIGDSVINIKRLMLEDDVPIGIDDFFTSSKKYPNLLDNLSGDTSLYQLLSNQYNVTVSRSSLEINGITADEETAKSLQSFIGDPLFVIDKTSVDQQDQIIHYSTSIIRCDRVSYVIDISDKTFIKKKNKF